MVEENLDDSAKVEAEQSPASSEDTEAPPRLYKPEEVSLVVQRERQKAYEKGKREALAMQLPEQAAPVAAPVQAQAAPAAPAMQPAPQMSEDNVRQMVGQEAARYIQQQQNQAHADKLVGTLTSKIQGAKETHPDLEQKLSKLNLGHAAGVLALATDLDNTPDVLSEFVNHPMKLMNMQNLLLTHPQAAMEEMKKLSDSIKQNQAAAASQTQTKQPFNQLKPSQKAGVDSGSMSVSDFRRQFATKKR